MMQRKRRYVNYHMTNIIMLNDLFQEAKKI